MARADKKPGYCSKACSTLGTRAAKSTALRKFHEVHPGAAVLSGLKTSATKKARMAEDPNYKERLQAQALALPPTSPASAAKRLTTLNERYTKEQQMTWASRGGSTGPAWNQGLTKATDDRVARQAESLKGHPPYQGSGRGKGGIRSDLGFYVRSTWEADVARVFHLLGRTFEYEPRTFDLGGDTYLPDFYLPDLDLWVEVSGWVSPDKEMKLAGMARLFPEQVLLHIDRPAYTWLWECFSSQIPEWEGQGRGPSRPVPLFTSRLQEAV